ncbi:hypothetical protein JCM33374_g3943 [Metschnikowia sp. JCM 33374]|nr:hypothetical protein JCM33374_g3943 [Metschnikowia sp. JCM 33374]
MKPALLKNWHQDEKFLFVDTRSNKDARLILDAIGEFYGQMKPPPPLGLRAMIIGMPNVGKSTLVNTLRSVGYTSQLPDGVSSKKNKKVARTGGQPGVTRNTSEIIRLSRNPDVLVYDTPGVFLPTVKDAETMLALSLVGCIQSSFVDPVIQADYLLYVLNLQNSKGQGYSEFMDHPTNNVQELLYHIAKKKGKLSANGSYDEIGMAEHWTNMWRQGKSRKFKGLFDVAAIKEATSGEVKSALESELTRLKDSGVHTRIVNSLGEDGTGSSKTRNRTAKDREFDIRNQLFKL